MISFLLFIFLQVEYYILSKINLMNLNKCKQLTVVFLLFSIAACQKNIEIIPQQAQKLPSRMVTAWNTQIMHLIKTSDGYTLPVSSRAIAFCGMAMYESILPAMPHHLSLSQSIPNFTYEKMFNPNELIDVEISLNAANADLCRHLFKTAPFEEIIAINTFERLWLDNLDKQWDDQAIINRSIAWGKSVAAALINLEITDDIAHEGYYKNFTGNYEINPAEYSWKPTPPHYSNPLFPAWQYATPIGVFTQNLMALPPFTFSTDPESKMYSDAMEVYTMSQNLSDEQKHMAEFWDDEMPLTSMGSAGRWTSILSNYISDQNVNLEIAVNAYVKSTLALYNAGIISWQAKYNFDRLRPISYIRNYIDSDFDEYMSATPGPEYISEHTLMAFAAGSILNSIFGQQAFTDRCHADRQDINGTPRSFNSFMHAAEECAISRLYAGTNFRHSIKESERLGKMCAKQVIQNIRWKF
ncbi:hypothetical protein BH23THE1_BH23THE1_35920 [soil metagenome]